MTIGSDAGTASAPERNGAAHKMAGADEVVVDVRNQIVTTPCSMATHSIEEVAEGAGKLVAKVVAMARLREAAHTAGMGRESASL